MNRHEKHKRKHDDSRHSKKEKRTEDDYDIFRKYKSEFSKLFSYHEEIITNFEDFWSFLLKFETAEKRKPTSTEFDRTSLINFKTKSSISKLHDKFPSFDRSGEKTRVNYESFCKFVGVILLYMDFKQKEKFIKLKKLRKTQKQLPISEYKEEILKALDTNRVLLIAGDTGCGKSTQVPQYVHYAGYNKIACTQPRRIACISLANRVAFETLTEFKSLVGYQIRFDKTKKKETKIIFITEGLLLRQASDAEILLSYDVVILDEVHERHLYGDFLTGIMKCLLYKRDDFKLILMSATINIKLFSDYFSEENIKVIQVPGRLYPIEFFYKPIIQDRYEKTKKFDSSPYVQILQKIDNDYPKYERGDVLVFLSGIADITRLAEDVIEYNKEKQNWIVLPLHSSLSIAEQDRVFHYAPEGMRKCIISTNIAETSVTIDGVRFVIDSGKVNRMSYCTVGGINKLTEQPISQDSAKQRSGRAGRTGPGVCYRLYSEEEFNKFEPFTVAEIHLVPLETLVLHMLSLGLKNITNFPFLEKPDMSAVSETLKALHFHGAIDSVDDPCLTTLGKALSKMPVELTIGKMLISATVFGNITGVLSLAAVISVPSPLTNRAYRDIDCQNARKVLESNHGDPITLLNIFKEWLDVKQNTQPLNYNQNIKSSRHWAKQRGIEEQRFYDVMKLMTQFKEILEESKLLTNEVLDRNSSFERSMRHGELKKLKSLHYELKTDMKTKSNKRLKYRQDDDDDHLKTDIRDIDFRIHYDSTTLQKLLHDTSVDSYTDLMLLKITLCSGLYPQIAVADEYNYCKSHQEQLFHTKNKGFVSLHPMSFFGNNSDLLKLHDDDIEIPPEGFFSKNPLSQRHQILFYQSLLETTKVYLMNTLRMPALQTLLLFSKSIQTNETLSKIIFDEFLMMNLPNFGEGKLLLVKAVELRKRWTKLLNDKLEGVIPSKALSEELIYDIVNFMKFKVSYTIKRLLKADLKTIYTFITPDSLLQVNKNPFDPDFPIECDNNFGGIKVTEYCTYCCLLEEEWSLNLLEKINSINVTCTTCNQVLYGTVLEKMEHENICVENSKPKKEVVMEIDVNKSNTKLFDCDTCKQTLRLSNIDILRHKKKCR